MKYLLNAVVPPVDRGTMIISNPRKLSEVLDEVKRFARDAVIAIGHPQTAELLGVSPSRISITPKPGDEAIVVRLVQRAATLGDVSAPDLIDQLEVRKVLYLPADNDPEL